MLDDKQSSIVRPKAVPPMFTPVSTSNSQSSTTMQTQNRLSHQALTEIGTMIRKHDRDATRLYDCIGPVKVFSYNSTELRWENSPNIEGTLCLYERQQVTNNKANVSYAFAVIQGDKYLIQPITSDMMQHADKLRLFYEVARNDRREVFCLHFLTEPECLRISAYLNRCIQAMKALEQQQHQQPQQQPHQQQQHQHQQQQHQHQQQQHQHQQHQHQRQQQAPIMSPSSIPVDTQTQLNGPMPPTMPVQQTPTNVYRQPASQQPVILPNQPAPQFGSSRIHVNQTPTRLTTSSNVSTQQPPQPMNTYSPQIPIDLLQTQFARLTPTVQSTPIGQIEIPKPIEQSQFPPSPIPLTNGNNNTNNINNPNTEDPTSSLKRLLNIRGQNPLENLSLDDNPVFPKQQTQPNLLDLMPPSAFEPIAATPPSPVVAIGAERTKHRLSTQMPTMISREHFRNVLLHLVQNDDHFLDIIYQACLNHPSTTQ